MSEPKRRTIRDAVKDRSAAKPITTVIERDLAQMEKESLVKAAGPQKMCPHCGWRFAATNRLVPKHDVNSVPCPGSEQNPRNPDSDKSPLWCFKPPKQAAPSGVAITHKCGHVVEFEGPADPKHIKSFTEKRAGKNCKACNLAAEEKRREEARSKPKKPNKNNNGNWSEKQRLPDGARYEVVFSAEKQEWSGTLTIGEFGATGAASGIVKLLRKLDTAYRQSLWTKEVTP